MTNTKPTIYLKQSSGTYGVYQITKVNNVSPLETFRAPGDRSSGKQDEIVDKRIAVGLIYTAEQVDALVKCKDIHGKDTLYNVTITA